MVVIKYITLALIFICSYYIGVLVSNKYSNRVNELKEMKTALNIFETKINFTYEPIPKIFDEISSRTSENISKIFKTASEQMQYTDAESAWNKSLDITLTNMNKEDIQIIKGLSNQLGRVDIEGQVSQIKLIDNFLNTQIEKAEQEKNKNEKMYKSLGITVGLAIVIILI